MRAGDPTKAAIASRRAAAVYGGVILREHLEDHPENYTRFLLLAPSAEVAENADKLSLVLHLAHKPGSLCRVAERVRAAQSEFAEDRKPADSRHALELLLSISISRPRSRIRKRARRSRNSKNSPIR